uniref:Uncharacterized protein n=1 Tax=Trypanosoma vivax (strain Y486) TaxID=1055687 RepID=G0TUS6_TRYVY|nr:hypothetical protein, unlikely [Trypanosoma vivax Y486]
MKVCFLCPPCFYERRNGCRRTIERVMPRMIENHTKWCLTRCSYAIVHTTVGSVLTTDNDTPETSNLVQSMIASLQNTSLRKMAANYSNHCSEAAGRAGGQLAEHFVSLLFRKDCINPSG